ncbi:hypothetical protein [Xylanibacter caecicola]|uniref:hypothetical protein n=1 Tax=Xylanibacter caecicola TaxID=2736294 RepID=UPI00258693D0|nr:hypothetical protein [Xylanibacter caecicola]
MKKIFIVAAMFAAMTFTGCGNGQKQNTDDADSTKVEATTNEEADSEIKTAIENMTAQLDAKNAKEFNSTLAKVQEEIQKLIKTNPEAAKACLQQLQEYLKKNSEQIKSIAGDKAAAAAAAISNVPAAQIIETLKSQAGTAAKTGNNAISKAAEAVEAAKNAPEEAKKAVNDAVEKGKAEAEAKAAKRAEEGKKKANEAIDKGVNDIKNKLGL